MSLLYKILYEVYNKVLLNIKNIKIWGTTVYYYTNKQIIKLESRKQKVVLIGFNDIGYYKLWDLTTKRIVWCRDTIINENNFYYKDNLKIE